MRSAKMLARALGVEGVVVEDVLFEGEEAFVPECAHGPDRAEGAPVHGAVPRYDAGVRTRRWRARDLGLMRAYVEAEARESSV
ncbi:MAG: hypothetical protein U0353_19905 [Sandaracinus sp.]